MQQVSRGFTRETLIALTTNIESREHRRVDIASSHGLPENPRASTTDDVECFFSVLRDSTHTEKDFTVKKVCLRMFLYLYGDDCL